MKLSPVDAVIFIILVLSNVIIGVSFYFRSRSSDQFVTAGGNIPAWVAGMSIFATYLSSISFLALPGKAYMTDWNAFVFSLSIPVASFAAVRYFVPHYRKIGNPSAYYFLEMRFGSWARIYASSCYVLTQLMRTGAILLLLALPLNALFGWNIKAIIILTGLSVILYSMLGGIRAVVWTDTIQAFILITGALICAVYITLSMPGGAGQVFSIGASNGKFSLGSFGTSLSESTFWVVLVYGLFINLQNYSIDQNYIQRYMTTGSDREAKKSALFGSLLYLPVSMLFFYIGTALFAFYTAQPGRLAEELRPVSAGDRVFPYFIVHELPAGLTGLLIASIFAAGMSTISTSLNSTATIVLTDYFRKFAKRDPAEKASMRILYAATAATGFAGTAIALALTGVESVLDAWWALASIFSGGMLGLFLLGFLPVKAGKTEAVIGVTAGIIVIVWMSLSPLLPDNGRLASFRNPVHSNLTIVFGTIVIFLTGFLISSYRARKRHS
ncbi:MAG TPA: sodium:solute symporter [Bacteroidales bacterium]|nr:sodium:solute symporter [Bacteroidales bacterium]